MMMTYHTYYTLNGEYLDGWDSVQEGGARPDVRCAVERLTNAQEGDILRMYLREVTPTGYVLPPVVQFVCITGTEGKPTTLDDKHVHDHPTPPFVADGLAQLTERVERIERHLFSVEA